MRRAHTSIVCAFWLMVGRISTTWTEPSMREETTSSAVSGAKRISRSNGYCESHDKSAPRSTIPCSISCTSPSAC